MRKYRRHRRHKPTVAPVRQRRRRRRKPLAQKVLEVLLAHHEDARVEHQPVPAGTDEWAFALVVPAGAYTPALVSVLASQALPKGWRADAVILPASDDNLRVLSVRVRRTRTESRWERRIVARRPFG